MPAEGAFVWGRAGKRWSRAFWAKIFYIELFGSSAVCMSLILIYLSSEIMSSEPLYKMGAGGAILIVLYMFREVYRLFGQMFRNMDEASARKRTGEVLDNLGQGYAVFHEYDGVKGMVDHVVTGVGCFVMMETVRGWGSIRAENRKLVCPEWIRVDDWVENVRMKVYEVKKVLESRGFYDLNPLPALVFPEASMPENLKYKEVFLLSVQKLDEWIKARNEVDEFFDTGIINEILMSNRGKPKKK